MLMESVAGSPWNRWPNVRGLDGRMVAEFARHSHESSFVLDQARKSGVRLGFNRMMVSESVERNWRRRILSSTSGARQFDFSPESHLVIHSEPDIVLLILKDIVPSHWWDVLNPDCVPPVGRSTVPPVGHTVIF